MSYIEGQFDGVFIGATDSFGNQLKCGDKVVYHESYTETKAYLAKDGWGRDVMLSKPIVTNAESKETIGTVKYSQDKCEFLVVFDEYLLWTARKEQSVCSLLGRDGCVLTLL